MNKFGRYLILSVGGFVIVGLLAIGSYGAIRSINGLAVAQTGTLWNNLKDAAFGDDATKGIMVVSPYLFDGTNFDRARGDTANGIDVDVTRLNDGGNIISVDDGAGSLTVDGTITSIGNTTPSDTFTNPTTSIPTFSLNAGWNGATWDRTRYFLDGDAGAIGTVNIQPVFSFGRVFNGTTWDRMRGNIINGLLVDVSRIQSTVTIDGVVRGENTPMDTFNNPNDSINMNSLNSAFDDGTSKWERNRSLDTDSDNHLVIARGALSTLNHIYEFDGTTFDRIRHSFNQNTIDITTNGTGTTVDMTQTPMSKYTMVVNRTAGATNVVEIDFECSLNDTAFVQKGTIITLATNPFSVSLGDVPCNQMRYNVVTVGAGNTLDIDLLSMR